ncbi:hypothetical protein HO173_000550 [Letharia columbiana]|uniref:Uncharacterized protein n=1 Tax=Letharia columbiana TaxID=112416 RepID=A0A8H6G748_9LECA|nr:uncharacterized protein HO173_000550 [Letharia columbiana]KAF6241838.1 hypothetical protein HO173_000550 [Letharia columbiana]
MEHRHQRAHLPRSLAELDYDQGTDLRHIDDKDLNCHDDHPKPCFLLHGIQAQQLQVIVLTSGVDDGDLFTSEANTPTTASNSTLPSSRGSSTLSQLASSQCSELTEL